ncbi:MAG: pyrroline-5-carboxylate reductase [Gammaproteobacteria bacterium]|nr:pyrroline-5-carboxylate reductase [Gammaproteobacteria bacterium]
MNQTIGFIGGGNMAASLIGGMATAGANHRQLMVYDPDATRCAQLQRDYGVHIAADNNALVTQSDVIVLAVKPQVLKQVLEPLGEVCRDKRPLILSIVAGIRIDSILRWLNCDLPVIRAMPNTPALVGLGATGMFANAAVSDQQRALAKTLLDAVGLSCWVKNESDIDAVTALSGSSPAYFMRFLEALIEAGTDAGLAADTSAALALQTMRGTAHLVGSSDQALAQLITNVTSPQGTTERALSALDSGGLKDLVKTAFSAAQQRAGELAEELDPDSVN